ncbi:MAG TPA: GGDEF domain-containing protein [Anaerolineales bacterium]|nr:GGDEF domain-containing protein [Anaerolineales bacterium]HNA89787.1 GGDEF domain-containing protein [Anaerolineales bacterium]HNB37183.1 GGDEF domain-containing protein [Anaerolineales bacterium]HNC09829.1 GGDEF domain-containing protein [Anaerolineales bacterium]
MQSLAEILTNQEIESVLDKIQAIVALVDREGNLIAWNTAFEKGKRQFADANSLLDFFNSREKDILKSKLSESMASQWLGELPFTENGGAVFYDLCLTPVREQRFLFIAERIDSVADAEVVIEKLSKQVKLYQIESEHSKKLARNKQIEMEAVLAQAQEVAHVDPLTFLPNRRTIVKDLQNEVLRAERYGSMFSISVLDLDSFKSINDTFGHPVGDEVLKNVAILLRDSIRHPDVVGRYGGEEFLILLPNSNATSAAEQANRLCREIRSKLVHTKEHDIQVTFSIGIAQFRTGEDSWHSLLKRADNAMFKAKNNGRDRWVIAE